MTQDFHQQFPHSGQGKRHPYILERLSTTDPHTILDYGAGKGNTTRWLYQLGYAPTAYDPSYEPYNKPEHLARTYDLLLTQDVLEHIPDDEIDWDTFKRVSQEHIHIIDLTPAKKKLKDGRNAHVNLKTALEWQHQFNTHLNPRWLDVKLHQEPDPNYTWRERLCVHIKL